MDELKIENLKEIIKASGLNKYSELSNSNIRFSDIKSLKRHKKEIDEIIGQLPELWEKYKIFYNL